MAAAIKGREEIASTVVSGNGDTSSEKMSVNASTKVIIAELTVSSRTDGTYTMKLEHSHNGSNWETLQAASGVSSNDTIYLSHEESADGPFLSNIRITVTAASVTTGATIAASLYHDK